MFELWTELGKGIPDWLVPLSSSHFVDFNQGMMMFYF